MSDETYTPQSTSELRNVVNTVLEDRLDDPALNDVDVLGSLAASIAVTLHENHETAIADVSRQAFLQTATGEQLTLKAKEYGVDRRDAVKATGVVSFSRSSDATTDYTIPAGTKVQTTDGDVRFETVSDVVLQSGTQSVDATVQAVAGGSDGNVPAGKVTSFVSKPSGVENVSNSNPIGDSDFSDTDGDALVSGEDRESDGELRERALDASSIGGAATAAAIETRLRDVDGVRSVTAKVNDSSSTDGDGLPPYSSELIVSGGTRDAVANGIVDVTAVTELLRLQEGVVGESLSSTPSVYIDLLDENVDVHFSRPVDVSLDVSLEVVTESSDAYVGAQPLRNNIVDYVGGTNTDGEPVDGLETGDNVIVDRIEDAVVGGDTGVNGVSSITVDVTGDGTDDTVTDGNGLRVVEISDSELANVVADDVEIITL